MASAKFIWLFTVSRDIAWDEGYLLISMTGFLQGHPLYDEVFSQYGPSYYLLRGGLISLLHIPLDHDWTRLGTMATWLLCALALSIATWRLTRSVWLAWLAWLQGVVLLSALANEPGHPQELVVLALAASTLVIGWRHITGISWMLLAALTALIATTKINVGAFLLLGVTLFLSSPIRAGNSRPTALHTVSRATLFAAMPFMLMWRHAAAEPWAMVYASCAATAIFCAALTLSREQAYPSTALVLRDVARPFAVGFVAIASLSCAGAWLSGTSLSGLLRGTVIAPLGLSGIFTMPLQATPSAAISALAALVACLALLRRDLSAPATQTTLSAIKLLFGALGALVLVGQPDKQLLWLGPWLWLAALPADRSRPESDSSQPASRAGLLVALAVFQLMQAYPVAGSQVAWSTVLMIPLYALCLHDGVAGLYRRRSERAGRSAEPAPVADTTADASPPPPAGDSGPRLVQLSAKVATCAALLWLFVQVWTDLPALRARNAHLQPLDLPGTHLVRLEPQGVALYRSLTEYLQQESDGFTTYPGFHSLHLWTGIAPPTWHNVTTWKLLDEAQQNDVINALEQLERPRIVMTRDFFSPWQASDPTALSPFARYVVGHYVEVARAGPIIILGKHPNGAPPTTAPAPSLSPPADSSEQALPDPNREAR
ncbi:MAG: hypothetical protein KDJ14_14710 [Xanthomonadales bacterium]|nr:hypothetical protein [Xanthomonadales bacterium]